MVRQFPLSGPNDFRRGSAFTIVGSNASSLSVPSDFSGSDVHTAASTLYAANVCGKRCEGVNIYGLTLTAATTAARTLTCTTVDGGLDDYTQNPLTISIPDASKVGDYIPVGGPNGVFLPGRSSDGTLLGGGFAFKTSNNEVRGELWWEPVGSAT